MVDRLSYDRVGHLVAVLTTDFEEIIADKRRTENRQANCCWVVAIE